MLKLRLFDNYIGDVKISPSQSLSLSLSLARVTSNIVSANFSFVPKVY